MPKITGKTIAGKSRRGFTLVELMISVALALVLLLGINQVFKITGDTVGAGQTLSEATRDARAAVAVMTSDFHNFASNSPLMVISCQTSMVGAGRVYGDTPTPFYYLNHTDELSGDALAATLTPAILNYHSHRCDMIGFFVSGNYHRQAANDTALVDDMTSSEAWVWYGHLNVADPINGGNAIGSGINKYASNLVLGRRVILLRQKNSSGQIVDNAGAAQAFYEAAGRSRPWHMERPSTIARAARPA